jgi:HEAT repeats
MRANDACLATHGVRAGRVVAGIASAGVLLALGLLVACGRSTPRDEPASAPQADDSDGQRQQSVVADEMPVVSPAAPSGVPPTARAVDDGQPAEARRAFELALIDPDRRVRKAAIDGLTALGGDESARALAIVQSDEDPRLRQDAVHALGEIGGATATRLVRQALLDENPAVRQAAAELLTQMPALPAD